MKKLTLETAGCDCTRIDGRSPADFPPGARTPLHRRLGARTRLISTIVLALSVACVAHGQDNSLYQVLHNFGGSDPAGSLPESTMVFDSAGNGYGTCVHGGSAGKGTLWKWSAQAGVTALHVFATNGTQGEYPYCDPVLDSAGNIYGTSYEGGNYDEGIVWKYSPSGTFSNLYSFGGYEGAYPYTGVTIDSSGNLYGMAEFGGSSNSGSAWKMAGNGSMSLLESFNYSTGDLPETGRACSVTRTETCMGPVTTEAPTAEGRSGKSLPPARSKSCTTLAER